MFIQLKTRLVTKLCCNPNVKPRYNFYYRRLINVASLFDKEKVWKKTLHNFIVVKIKIVMNIPSKQMLAQNQQ